MLALMIVAYVVMVGVLAWVYQVFRKRVARRVRFARVLGGGAIMAVLTFTAMISESLVGHCGVPAIIAMENEGAVVNKVGADAAHVLQCVNDSSTQVSVAMLVQLVTLVVVAVWASRLISEKRPPEAPSEPMYPDAFKD